MRVPLLLAVLGVAFAGCTSTPPPAELPPGDEVVELLPPPAIDVYIRHDFSRFPWAHVVEMPENATVERYLMTFAVLPTHTAVAGACLAGTARIVIRDPTGAVWDEMAPSATTGGAQAAGTTQGACSNRVEKDSEPGFPLAPGRWTFEFLGNGLAWGYVVMNADKERAPL